MVPILLIFVIKSDRCGLDLDTEFRTERRTEHRTECHTERRTQQISFISGPRCCLIEVELPSRCVVLGSWSLHNFWLLSCKFLWGAD